MPIWPLYMIWAVALIPVGMKFGDWKSAAAILLGLVLVRLNAFTPEVWRELLSASIWLLIAALLLYSRRYVASALIGFSALVYLPMLVFGYRIEYFGLLPILSDAFLILALGVSTGGAIGIGSNRSDNSHRPDRLAVAIQSGMAARQARNIAFYRGDNE